MEKETYQGWVRELWRAKEIVISERNALLKEFQNEFPPQKNAKGWMLVGRQCGKKNCPDCPHTLYWHWYSRKEGKVFWGKKKLDKLPKSFWNSRRTDRVKDRFEYYEENMTRLNKQFKRIQDTIKKTCLSMRACIKAIR